MIGVIAIVGKALLVLTGTYEVVIRIFPTVKNYSLIHKILEVATFVSNLLNVKK